MRVLNVAITAEKNKYSAIVGYDSFLQRTTFKSYIIYQRNQIFVKEKLGIVFT